MYKCKAQHEQAQHEQAQHEQAFTGRFKQENNKRF